MGRGGGETFAETDAVLAFAEGNLGEIVLAHQPDEVLHRLDVERAGFARGGGFRIGGHGGDPARFGSMGRRFGRGDPR